jgi:hypothetical protein
MRVDPNRQGRRTLPLAGVWNPRIQILNQQRLWSSLPRVVDVMPDATRIQLGRVWGSFSQPLDLKAVPVDSQRIAIAQGVARASRLVLFPT